ncbi:MAG TPA: thioredoxin reductase [Candidatus Bathyarchaeota archaeon]|nr:thioredoxin reductase [Candidatus Bathyarchaeota archaeon]
MNEEKREVVIIGAGPAGLTAGIYLAQNKIDITILERGLPGGRMGEAVEIDNYPGFPEGVTGKELTERMVSQLERFGVKIRFPEEVLKFSFTESGKEVFTRKTRYLAKAVIIATGGESMKLNIAGEERLLGRGVSYCAVCDGFFFRGKTVCVIGRGEEAGQDALYLSNLADEVYLLMYGKEEMSGSTFDKVKDRENIHMLEGTPLEILGKEKVEGVKIERDGKTEILRVDGVFIGLGMTPSTRIAKEAGIKVNEKREIIVDKRQMTNIEGVFAAGDCTGGFKQIVIAAGEGATAALYAIRYLRRRL